MLILLAGVSLSLYLRLVSKSMTAANVQRRSEVPGAAGNGHGAWIDVDKLEAGSTGSFLLTDPASNRKLPTRVFYATPSSLNET